MITASQLAAALGAKLERAQAWVDPLNAAMDRFEINKRERAAAFLAQIGHESGLLSRLVENLNYSGKGLLSTFPKYFTPATAKKYEHRPTAIANRVYANRYGNGDEKSGDGWRYRGRGLVQLTFKDNYSACGDALGISLVEHPEALEQPQNAALAAGWFWQAHGCNALADANEFSAITKVINGGLNGQKQREALWASAKKALAVA